MHQRGHPSVDGAGRAATPAWVPAFIALAILWGCSFAFIRIGLRGLSPVQVASIRLILGAAALLLIAAVTRTRLPRSRTTWAHLAVVAGLLNAVPFTLFAIGQHGHLPDAAGRRRRRGERPR